MFDFDVGKLLIFGIVALAVIPPKDLPRVMRVVGQALGRMRRMAAEFQGQFMDAMREADLDSVKKELESVKSDFDIAQNVVQKELNSIEQSAKIESSFDPAMAVHSEQSHAVGAPKDVGQSEISLTGSAIAAAEAAADVAAPPAADALAAVAPPAAEQEAAAPPRDAAE